MRLRNIAWMLSAFVALMTAVFAQTVHNGFQRRSGVPLDAKHDLNYGKLPLAFEANRGQAEPQVKFLFRGRGYTGLLTSDSIVLSTSPSKVIPVEQPDTAPTSAVPTMPPTIVQFRLLGAAKNQTVVGEDLEPGKANYFIGNDSSKWHTNVPTYGRVRYKSVYPGIDLIYYGNHRQLEYDFVISPGADPQQIQFDVQGAKTIHLDSSGNLILQTGDAELSFQNPAVYQESNGRRVPVAGTYVLTDSKHVTFRLAAYDPSKTLVIDPVLVYGTYLGGVGGDQATGIAVDGAGSAYIVGYTNSPDFALTTIGAPLTNSNHIFVAKLDPNGSSLSYSDYIGGNGADYGIALALDSANNVFVTGSTTSSDFPIMKPYQSGKPGPYSGFVSKLSADGSSLIYSTYLGGSGFDQPSGIAVDTLGEASIAGSTSSLDFPVVNAYQTTALANQAGFYGNYGFVTKFSADGSSLVYSTYLAGNSNVVQDCGTPCWPAPYSAVAAVALDSNGSAYVAGTTNTYNFPTTSNSYLASNSTQQDATIGFVSKFRSSGNLDYSTYFYGSSGNPIGIGTIAVDGSGSAYIAGTASSDGTFPITSTGICDPGVYGFGCSYGFVTKFDPTAANLLYSTFLGPNNYASPQSIALDLNNNAYVLAATFSDIFGTNNGIEGYAGKEDMLLVEIDAAATTELFATYLGASGNDSPIGIALDANGSIYVTGSTDSGDFPVTQGVFQDLIGGNRDTFVMKIGNGSAPAVSLRPTVLQYAALQVGSTSQPQQALLRNMGSMPLSISSISISGDFAETDSCATSVPSAGSCTLSVAFSPTAVGSRSGSILIQDDAAGSPHIINLSGNGDGPDVSLTPASLIFAGQPLATSSPAQTVTLTNTGNATLSVGSIQATGDFSQTNNCPATLTPNSSCTIHVAFSPTTSGAENGSLSITDTAQGSPQVVSLTGVGIDFSISSSPSSISLKAGKTATYQLTVSPLGGAFTNLVNLSCSGAPAKAACSVTPNTVTPNGSAATAALTVTTTASTAQSARSSHDRTFYAIWMPLQGIGLFGMMMAGAGARSRKFRLIFLLFLISVASMFLVACAGGTGITTPPQNGTSPGTYTIIVTGTSGSLRHSIPVTLVVQ